MGETGTKGLVAERRDARLARLQLLLQDGGPTRLTEAAQLLGVSSMTLRRDLAGPGIPLALLGGHILPAADLLRPGQYALEQEQGSHVAEKRQAARHAVGLVGDRDTIFVDCGTTMPHLVEHLPPALTLTIVCYALNIATLVCRRPNTRVILLGGLFHPASATFSSDEALASLRRLRINTAFVSAGGVHPTSGVTCANFNEVPVKQAAINSAEHAVLVADGSKFGRLTSAYFAPATDFERIVTSPSAARDVLDDLAGLGCRLDVAPAEA